MNSNTFVNGFTPAQLALGQEPSMPGLLSDERTGPLQLQMTEQERLHRRLSMKFSAQQACGKAEIDVKLRRALLRRYTGKDEDLYPGERCLYWRDAADKAHTIRWKGPAIILAVERNPDTGTVACYWLAHGTVLLRAGAQHVRKLVNDNGMVDGPSRVQQALHNLRQRRAVRIIDLRKSNKRSIDEIDPEISDMEYTPTDTEAPPLTMSSPVQSDGHPVGSPQETPSEQQHAATERQHTSAAAEPPPAAVPIAPQEQATASAMLPAAALQPAPQPEEQAETRRPQLLERLMDDEDEEQPMDEPSRHGNANGTARSVKATSSSGG